MITIGVISDTHIPSLSQGIAKEVLTAFERADCIIHAGDVVDMSVIEELARIAPVHAVAGNMDNPALKSQLPLKKVIEIAGVRIGITHGAGSPFGIKKRILNSFKDDNVKCIIYGHTHKSEKEIIDGILLFNPGSACDNFFNRHRSFGMLFITEDKNIEAEIFTF